MSNTNRVGKRTEKRMRQAQAQRRQRLFTIIAVSAAAVIVSAMLIWPYIRPAYQGAMERPQAVEKSMGDPNAPVKVEEFSDFQCPFCRQYHTEIAEGFVEKYVATGQVYYTYVPFSFLGPESIQAAEASYCAMDQGKFWEYHDILFANQAGENAGNFNDSRLKDFAQQLKLDAGAFNTCLDSNQYEEQVAADVEYGRGKGINATPSFIVNDGTPVDMNSLEAAVDAALAGE